MHGRNWARLSEAVPSKTLTQIKNYYQNYKVKVRRCTFLRSLPMPKTHCHEGMVLLHDKGWV